jgi:hypothetical protein
MLSAYEWKGGLVWNEAGNEEEGRAARARISAPISQDTPTIVTVQPTIKHTRIGAS